MKNLKDARSCKFNFTFAVYQTMVCKTFEDLPIFPMITYIIAFFREKLK